MLKTPKRLYALSALAVMGFVLSVLLTLHYYELRAGSAGFKSLCNLGAAWDCNAVAASAAAELFWGIPLSSLSGAYFAVIFVVGIFAYNRFWRRESLRWIFALALAGSFVSLGYLALMITQIKTLCVYCLGVDASVLGLLLVSASLKPERLRSMRPDLKQWRVLAISSAVSLGVILLSFSTLNGARLSQAEIETQVKSILATPPVAVRSGPEFAAIGPENAPITIVEFSDFQCPYCRLGAYILNSVQIAFPKDVRVVFRHFPLDPRCNAQVKHSMHPVACEAAALAWCAHKQGKFSPVYEEFFEHQVQLLPGKVLSLAEKAGADGAALGTCSSGRDAELALRADIEEATRLGVQSTPTFFVNGYRVNGAFPAPIWKMLVAELLARKAPREQRGYAAR